MKEGGAKFQLNKFSINRVMPDENPIDPTEVADIIHRAVTFGLVSLYEKINAENARVLISVSSENGVRVVALTECSAELLEEFNRL